MSLHQTRWQTSHFSSLATGLAGGGTLKPSPLLEASDQASSWSVHPSAFSFSLLNFELTLFPYLFPISQLLCISVSFFYEYFFRSLRDLARSINWSHHAIRKKNNLWRTRAREWQVTKCFLDSLTEHSTRIPQDASVVFQIVYQIMLFMSFRRAHCSFSRILFLLRTACHTRY